MHPKISAMHTFCDSFLEDESFELVLLGENPGQLGLGGWHTLCVFHICFALLSSLLNFFRK